MAEFDGMLLREQKALEEKQARDPLPERGQGSGGSGAGSEAEGGGSGGQGKGKGKAGKAGERGDERTATEKQADAEATAAEKAAQQGEAAQAGAGAPPRDTGTGGSTGRTDGGTPVTAPVEGGPAGPGSDRTAVPPDVGDGKDDDVVARQLREAAMKETDPAIREKLWQEYRDYKKGAGKGGS